MTAEALPPLLVDEREARRLLLTPREAAQALAVCEKTLYTLTKRGELPSVRIGRTVRYAIADLRAFCEGRKGGAR